MYKRGFTFLEIMLALSILSLALLGFFQMFDTALNSSYRATQESIAINLGRGLMAEIMGKNFVDPQDPADTALGINSADGESISNRNTFDDVDDYKDYNESPPLTVVGGAPMNGTAGTPNYSRFSRSVSVVYCDISGSNIVDVAGPTDYKHITVSVSGPYVTNISLNEIRAK